MSDSSSPLNSSDWDFKSQTKKVIMKEPQSSLEDMPSYEKLCRWLIVQEN